MANTITGNKNTYWWLSVIIGIIFIVLGFWSLFTPVATLVTVAYFVGFLFLFTGICEMFSVSTNDANWGWSLVSGAIDFIVGVLFITMPPGEAILVISFLFGFWVLFRSLLGLGIIMNLKKSEDAGIVQRAKNAIFLPIIGIILGFLFLMSPVLAGGFIVGIFCAAIITFGVFEIYWGFFLKSSKN